ncbi:hypothetical protein [Streptomyces halobius]|uniref:hypothetical protein n=1 Tax=Streptomyces halobius TaxID=2879846 RepID=UPI0038736A65
MRKRRPQIVLEAKEGRRHLEGTVPQEKRPGEEAEVDFADVWLDLAGQRRKCVLFTLRMSYSGKAIHRVYTTASQEAFFEGHVEAFRALGGVPSVHIRYDNLKPAVKHVLFGRSRTETTRWVAFRSWYAFSPLYCGPGEEGAHEKGGVEHEGGRFSPFAEWDKIFADPRLCAAIGDRITFRCTLIQTAPSPTDTRPPRPNARRSQLSDRRQVHPRSGSVPPAPRGEPLALPCQCSLDLRHRQPGCLSDPVDPEAIGVVIEYPGDLAHPPRCPAEPDGHRGEALTTRPIGPTGHPSRPQR